MCSGLALLLLRPSPIHAAPPPPQCLLQFDQSVAYYGETLCFTLCITPQSRSFLEEPPVLCLGKNARILSFHKAKKEDTYTGTCTLLKKGKFLLTPTLSLRYTSAQKHPLYGIKTTTQTRFIALPTYPFHTRALPKPPPREFHGSVGDFSLHLEQLEESRYPEIRLSVTGIGQAPHPFLASQQWELLNTSTHTTEKTTTTHFTLKPLSQSPLIRCGICFFSPKTKRYTFDYVSALALTPLAPMQETSKPWYSRFSWRTFLFVLALWLMATLRKRPSIVSM